MDSAHHFVIGNRDEEYGFLLVHFREDPATHAEAIHFSLSIEDSPLRWRALSDGEPVLRSDVGTTGVRDPVIVRDDRGHFHILATDLRIYGGDQRGWDFWRRRGSRSLIAWESDDLVHWDGPRRLAVAPDTAGMAWAPEVTQDPDTGDFVVYWSSTLFNVRDPRHESDSYSRILFARTRDFREFSSAQVMIDSGRDIIDTTVVQYGDRVYRFSKDEDRGAESWGIFQEVGSGLFADDFETIARGIGAQVHVDLEAPIVVKSPDSDVWYLFLDRYGTVQGYTIFRTESLASGRWEAVPEQEVVIGPATKHGAVLRLTRSEWLRLSGAEQP